MNTSGGSQSERGMTMDVAAVARCSRCLALSIPIRADYTKVKVQLTLWGGGTATEPLRIGRSEVAPAAGPLLSKNPAACAQLG